MSLRERLLERERPSIVYDLRVAPSDETQVAEDELARARRMLTSTELQKTPDPKVVTRTKAALKKAQEKRDACYERIRLVALPPEEFESIGDAYPDQDSADEKKSREANFMYLQEVFLAVAPDDLSEGEWRTLMAEKMSTGELNDLFTAAVGINAHGRMPSAGVPKG